MKSCLLACGSILSALVVQGASVTRDIAYDTAIENYGLGDLYLPDRVAEDTPIVLVIHGGGWSGLDRASIEGVAEFFQKELGFAAFNIEYRLADAVDRPWPQCGEDCVKAAEYILTEDFKNQYGLSHSKIWICGASAGGHLALWTLVNLEPTKVEGAISISAIGDPELDFQVNSGRYNSLFPAPVTPEKLASMDPRALVTEGMAPLLCTHADIDAVVPIASHRAFETAYVNAGNRCTFFEYASNCELNEGGHFIWRAGYAPHKLISPIEGRIRRFVQEIRGVSTLVKLPNSNRNDVLTGSNSAGEEFVDNLVNNGTVWKTGAGRTTYVAPALYGSGQFNVATGTAALDFRSAPAVPTVLKDLMPKMKLWLDAEKNVTIENGQVVDWFDCRETNPTTDTKAYPYASSRFAWMTSDYSKKTVAKPGEPIYVKNINAFDYIDFGPRIGGNTVVGGKWLSITNTASSGLDAQWGLIHAREMFAIVRKHPGNGNFGLNSIINLAQNNMSSPYWCGSNDKLWASSANTHADKGATRFDRTDVWGEDFRVDDTEWHLVSTRMAIDGSRCDVNQIGCDRIIASGGMQIAELILVTDRLSEIDRMRIEDYLWKKYFGARQSTFGHISIDKTAIVEMDTASTVVGSLSGGGTLKVSGPGTVTAVNKGFDGEVALATGSSFQTEDIPIAFTETSQKITVDNNHVAKMIAGQMPDTAEIVASQSVAVSGVRPGTKVLNVTGSGRKVRISPPRKEGAVAGAAEFPNGDFEKFSSQPSHLEVVNFAGGAGQCVTNENWVFDRSMATGGNLVLVMFTNSYLNTTHSWNTKTRPWPGLGWDGRSWGYICKGELSGFFTVAKAGYYRLQFRTSSRDTKAHKEISLKLDDVEFRRTTSFDWTQFLRYEADLPYLTAGEHKITFADASGNTEVYTFDDVKVLPVALSDTPAVKVDIKNPSFEEPLSNLGSATVDPGTMRNFVPSETALTGWTITGTESDSKVFQNRIRRRWFDDVVNMTSGIVDGKHQTPDEMPDGFLAARLYWDTEFSQKVNFPVAGRYRLVFYLSKRDGCDQQKVRVKVGDDLVKYVWARETFFKRCEFVFDIAVAGERTLAFAGVNTVTANSNAFSRPDAFLDAISCERIGSTPNNLIVSGDFETGSAWRGSGSYSLVSAWPNIIDWPNLGGSVSPDVPTTGEDSALLRGESSDCHQVVNLAAGHYELSFSLRSTRRSSSDNGDWEIAVYEGKDEESLNTIWFATSLNHPDERRIKLPFDVDAGGERVIGFSFRSPHAKTGYAIVDDVELVATAAPVARMDLADYLPKDLEINIDSGAQLLLDFDGEARVGKVTYAGRRFYNGKILTGEISSRRFPGLINGRGRLHVNERALLVVVR